MEIGAKPTDLFGSPSVESMFTAGQSGGATPEQETARITIQAYQREINRIRGYKLELTPAENQRLRKIQEQVQQIKQKASLGTVRQDELDDRLGELAGILEALLEPKLNPAVKKRVKATVEERLTDNSTNATLRRQFQNVTAQIASIMTPRPITALSTAERNSYDDLAELINDAAGAKIQLTAKEARRVAELEESIISLQGQLGADPSQQPTAAAVSRAYTRLG